MMFDQKSFVLTRPSVSIFWFATVRMGKDLFRCPILKNNRAYLSIRNPLRGDYHFSWVIIIYWTLILFPYQQIEIFKTRFPTSLVKLVRHVSYAPRQPSCSELLSTTLIVQSPVSVNGFNLFSRDLNWSKNDLNICPILLTRPNRFLCPYILFHRFLCFHDVTTIIS